MSKSALLEQSTPVSSVLARVKFIGLFVLLLSGGPIAMGVLEYLQYFHHNWLQSQIVVDANDVFNTLIAGSQMSAETIAVKNKKDIAEKLLSDAQLLWDSIPVGTTIKINRVDVGKNSEVERLRSEASAIFEELKMQKVTLARAVGNSLVGGSNETVWLKFKVTADKLDALECQHPWFYKSTVIRVATGIFCFLISVPYIAFIFGMVFVLGRLPNWIIAKLKNLRNR